MSTSILWVYSPLSSKYSVAPKDARLKAKIAVLSDAELHLPFPTPALQAETHHFDDWGLRCSGQPWPLERHRCDWWD
jgi:hypothetical protein